MQGVAGVIDKDFSAAKLAEDIQADELVILTTVDNAYVNYNQPDQAPIGKVKVDQLKKYLEAVINFVEKTGNTAIITSLRNASKLDDGVGTIVYN